MASDISTKNLIAQKVFSIDQKIDKKVNIVTKAKLIQKEIFESKNDNSYEQKLKELRTLKYLKEHSQVRQDSYIDIVVSILGLFIIIFAILIY